MDNSLEIDGRQLCSVKKAAQTVAYSHDYVTRLAREGKIIASCIKRKWFIDINSLKNYVESITAEKEIRSKFLSLKYSKDQKLKDELSDRTVLNISKTKVLHVRSAVLAALVLFIGVATGVAVSSSDLTKVSISLFQSGEEYNIAQVSESKPASLEYVDQIKAEPTSRTISSLGDVKEGVLLFPNVGGVENGVESLFSDVVQVRQLETGGQTVELLDKSGNTVGEPVQFLIVPVKNNQ